MPLLDVWPFACWDGVGKSIFACYLLYRLQQDHPTSSIIYVDFKRLTYKYMMFSPAGVVQAGDHITDFGAASSSSQNFIIFDMGGTADIVPSSDISPQVIVLSSANSKHFALFHRDFSRITLVMKTWSKEEIDDARNHIYTGIELNDYLLRFRDLGGVPRYVFDRDQSHTQVVQSFLNDLPSPNDICEVLKTKDLTRLEVDRGGRLITYETDADMQKTDVRWVSDHIGQWAMTAVAKSDERRTMDLLWAMSENPVSGGAFGIAFEAYAHLKLAEGGIFDYRLVGNSVTQKMYLKASETIYFDRCSDVSDEVIMLHRARCCCA